jgi:RNA polymerase sigma-70 factor (ECF subfamily)
LAGTLKPEYAEAIQAIDVQGLAVKTFAEEHGLSANNAGVRVFRAREALRKRVMESWAGTRRARSRRLRRTRIQHL